MTLGLSIHVELRKTKEESVHEGKLDRLAIPYKEALAAYDHALAVDPTEPRIYGRRADTYRALGETESQRYMFAFQAPVWVITALKDRRPGIISFSPHFLLQPAWEHEQQ